MKIFLILSAAIIFGCSNPDSASKVLAAQGYTNIHITGYSSLCGSDDWVETGFVAENPFGNTVRGAVCEGIMKGATIRFGY